MGPIRGALLDPVMVTLSITVAKGRAAIDSAKAWDTEYWQVILLGKKNGKSAPIPAGQSCVCGGGSRSVG